MDRASIRRHWLVYFFSALVFVFFLPQSVVAASLSLSDSTPETLSDLDQEYHTTVSLNIDAADGTIYYLRGVFSKEGSSNYCGKTWNGSSWFSGPFGSEGFRQLPSVTIASSTAVLTMKVKVDPQDSGCKTDGSYIFKVQRYTQSGSGTFDKQNEQKIAIQVPAPPPTATRVPSSHPTVAPTATIAPSRKPTAAAAPVEELSDVSPEEDELVTATVASQVVTVPPAVDLPATDAAHVLGISQQSGGSGGIAWFFLTAAGLLFGAAGYWAYIIYRKNRS